MKYIYALLLFYVSISPSGAMEQPYYQNSQSPFDTLKSKFQAPFPYKNHLCEDLCDVIKAGGIISVIKREGGDHHKKNDFIYVLRKLALNLKKINEMTRCNPYSEIIRSNEALTLKVIMRTTLPTVISTGIIVSITKSLEREDQDNKKTFFYHTILPAILTSPFVALGVEILPPLLDQLTSNVVEQFTEGVIVTLPSALTAQETLSKWGSRHFFKTAAKNVLKRSIFITTGAIIFCFFTSYNFE